MESELTTRLLFRHFEYFCVDTLNINILFSPSYSIIDSITLIGASTTEVFGEWGLKVLDGDELFYYRLHENGNLDGMILSHGDDFIMAGIDPFLR